MFVFRVLVGVANKIEKIMREYLWVGSKEDKDHLVNCNVVSPPRDEGERALGNIVAWDVAFLGKWLGRFPIGV